MSVLEVIKNRLTQRYLPFPVCKRVIERKTGLLPLMYHSIHREVFDYSFSIPGPSFSRQIEFLKQYAEFVHPHEITPQRRFDDGLYILVTFDDGYANNASVAAPLLDRYDVPAAFFVSVDLIDGEYQTYMSWDQLRRINESGQFVIGSHCLDHLTLDSLRHADAERQLRKSKERLDSELAKETYLFSYPGGVHNDRISSLVKESGYRLAFKDHFDGDATDSRPYTLARTSIDERNHALHRFSRTIAMSPTIARL